MFSPHAVSCDGLVIDMAVSCEYCGKSFRGDKISSRHIAACPYWPPTQTDPCLCGWSASSMRKMKEHRKVCEDWLSRDKKSVRNERMRANSLKKYGVESPLWTEEAVRKRTETNISRYGSANVFGRESTVYQKVQLSLEGKRPVLSGKDNPFAKPEVQAKVKATMLSRYGVERPSQCPEILERMIQTSNLRHGGVLKSSAKMTEKIRETNLKRYGDEVPQRTDIIKQRTMETNRTRFGVDWTCQHPDVRQKQNETQRLRWGSHFFASDEGKAQIKESLLERYGVDHSSKIKGFWTRASRTFMLKYGVPHPLQLPEFRDKQRRTNLERYSTPFPGLRVRGMNNLEAKVFALFPSGSIRFTGDGSWWRFLPKLGRHKNPDFIVVHDSESNRALGVVEVFGDYWHSSKFTGLDPKVHELDTIAAYLEVGLDCLVIWESDFHASADAVVARITQFLSFLVAKTENTAFSSFKEGPPS